MRRVGRLQILTEAFLICLSIFSFVAHSSLCVMLSGAGALLLLGLRFGQFLEARAGARCIQEIAESFAAAALGRERRIFLGLSPSQESTAERLNQAIAVVRDSIAAGLKEVEAQSAVLSSMSDAVVALDSKDRVIRVNPASMRLFDAGERSALGRHFHEFVFHAGLHDFLAKVKSAGEDIEAEFVINGSPTRSIRARGGLLRDRAGRNTGVLLVISDISEIRHLENVRRDFIANVSHELRTPITAIRGFVETLLDGAVNNPEDARRFMSIIARQSERLSAIFDDLLALSKMEFGQGRSEVKCKDEEAALLLNSAIESMSKKAQLRRVSIRAEAPAGLFVYCSAVLIEQAAVNLLDNAIRYSEPGSVVIVSAAADKFGVTISVLDDGPGIAEEHQGRIFERFYRVDKGRARTEGGTGLGLAIVKHIAEAHGGSAQVKSRLGEGATFTIFIPHPTSLRVVGA